LEIRVQILERAAQRQEQRNWMNAQQQWAAAYGSLPGPAPAVGVARHLLWPAQCHRRPKLRRLRLDPPRAARAGLHRWRQRRLLELWPPRVDSNALCSRVDQPHPRQLRPRPICPLRLSRSVWRRLPWRCPQPRLQQPQQRGLWLCSHRTGHGRPSGSNRPSFPRLRLPPRCPLTARPQHWPLPPSNRVKPTASARLGG
jgi:hypothetical protein